MTTVGGGLEIGMFQRSSDRPLSWGMPSWASGIFEIEQAALFAPPLTELTDLSKTREASGLQCDLFVCRKVLTIYLLPSLVIFAPGDLAVIQSKVDLLRGDDEARLNYGSALCSYGATIFA